MGAVILFALLWQPVPPVLEGQPAISYPPGASGDATVVLELEVDERGRVTSARVLASGGAAFDQAALAAAREFRFQPGRYQGQPVPFRVTYTHHFRAPVAPAPVPPGASAQQPPGGATALLRGRLLERGTRAPIPFALVRALGLVVQSDPDGRFELSLPAGPVSLSVSAPEHRKTELHEQLRAGETVAVTYYLERSQSARYETVVHGRPQREEVSRETLEAEEIAKVPGTLGDVLRAVLNLPGIARAPFNTGLIIVRGGRPTDSRVYIEGAEVPQLYHFGALSSVVASDLVGRIDFLPGNFSARYGRASAGTIDLDFREARRDRMHGEINSSVIDTGVLLEGPLGAGGFAIAARRSYIDAILPAVLPASADVDFTTAPRYYDYQALYDRPVGPGKLHLRAYGSDDELTFLIAHPRNVRFRGTFDTHVYFHRAQAEWDGKWGRSDVQVMDSVGFQRVFASVGEGLDLDVSIVSSHTRAEISQMVLPRLRVGAGLDAQLAYLAVDARAPAPLHEGEVGDPGTVRPIIETHQQRNASAIGAYAWADWDVTARLRLTPGVRFDWYALNQAATLDPRLQVHYALAPRTTLKGGVGLYSQPPQPQDTDPNFGNPAIGPEHAIHFGAGIERRFGKGLTGSLEGFYKHLFDLSAPSAQTIMTADGGVRKEGVASIGSGRVYGGEVLLRQALGRRFFGWLSYTLMRSERQDAPQKPLRLFDFDQTHVLTLALHANLWAGWEAGLRFRYVTGDPYTPRVGGLYNSDADTFTPIPGAINSARLPDYQQLDVRIDKNFVFERWLLALYVDVQNVYNYENVEGVRYSYDFQKTEPLTGLPILPAFGIRGKF
ncbi:MAG TPA: TonB-dependent receptor [Polyangia bacterium]|nr:TonB-dependent receptor [Polyangia bacterium]